MIRILHIVHALTRGGGLSNFVMNYYRQIDKSKVQFDFIYFREVESDFKDEIESLGGRYFKFTEPSLDFSYKRECEAFFKEHEGEYSAIHCHALFAAAVYGRIAKKYGVKSIIAHAHNVGYGKGFLRQVRNFYFIKRANVSSDIKLACSEDAARFMFGEKALKSGKVRVISNAIDCKKYYFDENIRAEAKKELGLTNEFVIGHVGGFAKQKNHMFLIDVFNEICKKRPDSKLLLMGADGVASGSTKPQVLEKIKEYGLENNVKFLGVRKDVNRVMMALDYFVFPSVFEGFGIVLVEAQASGLPCIASTTVPLEARCTELVKYFSLEDGAKVWAEEILSEKKDTDRRIDEEQLSKFNIVEQKSILEKIYLDMEEI